MGLRSGKLGPMSLETPADIPDEAGIEAMRAERERFNRGETFLDEDASPDDGTPPGQ